MSHPRKKEAFLIDRWKSIGYAMKGFAHLIQNERAVQVHCFLAILSITLSLIFGFSIQHFLFLLLALGLILSTEALNTAIEELCDFIHPDYHKKIGHIKDLSAGAVAFAAIFGYGIILFLFANHFQWIDF